MRSAPLAALLLLALATATGCPGDARPDTAGDDAGVTDAGPHGGRDAGPDDAGPDDAGPHGGRDAGPGGVLFGADPEPLRPELAASVLGRASLEVGGDWPLVVDVVLMHPDAYAAAPREALVLPEGWDARLLVELRGASGPPVALPLVRRQPGPARTLDATRVATFSAWTPVDAPPALAPGDYTLRVVLDTREVAVPGWRGRVQSPPVALRVVAEDPMPPERQRARQLALARHALVRGDAVAALHALDVSVEAARDAGVEDPALHALRAQVLAQLGTPNAARAAARAALAASARAEPGASEPPAPTLRLLRALERPDAGS